MPIKRYTAIADNSITNAYKEDNASRATTSNSGLSDSLEIFSLYNSIGDNTYEESRILLKFDAEQIKQDSTNKIFPSDAKFYLRLYNAVHPFTLPKQYNLNVHSLTKNFTEGQGLDMETYTDIDKSNWLAPSATENWTTAGGDYDTTQLGACTFTEGDEDLLIDITTHVGTWKVNSANHKGLIIKYPDSSQSETNSYYTKKFYARGTEYFFKKPVIEVRWDDSIKDNGLKLYRTSPRMSESDNTQRLYFYNWVNGELKDLPPETNGDPAALYFYLFSDTARTATIVSATSPTTTSTGVYYVDFVLPSTAPDLVYTKWSYPSGGTEEVYLQETLNVYDKDFSNDTNTPTYNITINNLKSSYSRDEKANFRLSIREKDKDVNIYTTSTKTFQNDIIEKIYYKITRTVDSVEVIPYSTGNLEYTRLSYDGNGNYFDFDMSLLEKDYMYEINLLYKTKTNHIEYSNSFKFRVE